MIDGRIIVIKKLFLLIALVLFLEPFTSAQSNILKKDACSIDDPIKFCIEDFNKYMNHDTFLAI